MDRPQLSSAASVESLDQIINVEGFNLSLRDAILIDLRRFITCPLLLDSSQNMVIFNNHCYDNDMFQGHKQSQMRRNEQYNLLNSSGEPTVFKDPCTRQEMNYNHAMNLLFSSLTRRQLSNILNSRVGLFQEYDVDIDDFLPQPHDYNFLNFVITLAGTDIIEVNSFVTKIKSLLVEKTMAIEELMLKF